MDICRGSSMATLCEITQCLSVSQICCKQVREVMNVSAARPPVLAHTSVSKMLVPLPRLQGDFVGGYPVRRANLLRTIDCTPKKTISVSNALFGAGLSYEMADSWTLPAAPEPVQFPRKSLNMKFAVLLMRSAYESVDALDFIPMDKFQEKFWKLRQSEVEPYTLQHRPLKVKYGDLTDPLYFDFISFAQFATISNEMRTGEVVFKEKQGADGEVHIVRRDGSLKDNSKLPNAFSRRVGDTIYQQLLDGFEGEIFNVPPPCPRDSDFSYVVEGVRKLLQTFVDQGYALNAVIDQAEPSSDRHGGTLRVKVEGSATLWGLQALVNRRAAILSNFDALAVGGFLRASQRMASYKVRYSDTTVQQLWTVS